MNTETGLTSEEARSRLKKFGPNAVPDTTQNPIRMALGKFSAPVPWMLEAAIVLQVVLGEYVEAAIIAGLLVFNAVLGFFQEGRLSNACRSEVAAGVDRDGPAQWRLDESARRRTGARRHREAVARRRGCRRHATGRRDRFCSISPCSRANPSPSKRPKFPNLCRAMVRRGEAVAEVTATGTRTKFGRTAELVLTAHVVSSQQKAVLRVVRNLAMFNGALIVILVAYAWAHAMPVPTSFPSSSRRFLPPSPS